MVQGVTTPFEKRLEIQGVGYNAVLDGKVLQLQVGFANAVRLPIPPEVSCELPDNTHIVLKSADRQAVAIGHRDRGVHHGDAAAHEVQRDVGAGDVGDDDVERRQPQGGARGERAPARRQQP